MISLIRIIILMSLINDIIGVISVSAIIIIIGNPINCDPYKAKVNEEYI